MNWNRKVLWLLLCAAPTWFAATLPLAAQLPSVPAPAAPVTTSPLGDLTSLTGDAKVWLQDLVKINTTNPPGNEQARR